MKTLILVFVVLFGYFVKWEEKRYYFQINNTPVDSRKIREHLRCVLLLNTQHKTTKYYRKRLSHK